ncbi:SAF domain-containing protein [Nocardioides caldifontis]|uniref:SAF domain-containing protein n=1 Tax=Nocardioides caldifontis TaxID=2588938 RepID=UPI00193A147A|nr:SAF domain-containing protein [Nocardioides caldifontis]
MTSTAARDDRLAVTDSPPPAPPLVPPPKLRRRPALMAAAIAAICLGALLAAWAWTSTTNTQEVLAARNTIPRGSVITADDIERVRINADPALEPLAASEYDAVVGRRAALDIAAGGLLTAEATTLVVLPPEGQSIVGIALTPAQLPGLPLQSGDIVRVIVTPGLDGEAPSGNPAFTSAEVVGTRPDEATGTTVVDVLVPYSDATVLAARAATGRVALVLDAAASGDQ